MNKLFEKYKTERDFAYNNIINRTFILIGVFLAVLIIYMCIFFSSAKPLWLLFCYLIEIIVAGALKKVSLTKDNEKLYYHNGGLFFVSFYQYIEEEKANENKTIYL